MDSYMQQVFNLQSHMNVRFTVKIRSLYDYQLRLLHGVMPPTSGVDIAATIKYFSQTLLTVLKDVPNYPLELLKSPEMDSVRMGLYPNLDYKGLYNCLIPLIEIAPLIQNGLHVFGQALLQCLGCLLPFLENDMINTLPYLTASTIAVLPSSLHQDIVNSLCFYILPFTITRHNEKEQDSLCHSVSAVIMMVFQYSSNPAHHCQLLECLMTLKQSILKDLLCVIAYGTSTARASAAKLLFYYWPAFNPNLFDRKGLICKFAGDYAPFVCQRDSCPNAGNAEAAKVCYDHCISITFASEKHPPLYLCIECANEIHREHPNQMFFDILHPMQQVSMICENKNCRSTDKSAISVCFSNECASYNGNHPIRYCQQCHSNRHNNRRGGDHIIHKSLPPTWSMEPEMQIYMVEAIVNLLKEAKVTKNEVKETGDGKMVITIQPDNISVEERQLLGRYGVWLLVGRCTPTEDTPVETLGRLLSMLFHWFHVTAFTFEGPEETTLEKLKTEYVCTWLQEISNTHYKVFVSCLLPHPPDYARVGGHWDTLASRTSHLKDGLHRLFCLVPYEIITPEIWDYIMPHWMEAIVNDVPEKELSELKIILNKMLDADLSPLGFDAGKMYNFMAIRFEKTTAKVQAQALQWLQILTVLEILIPLHLLFEIFGSGVQTLKAGVQESSEKALKHIKNEPPDGTRRSSIAPVVEDDTANRSLSDDDVRMNRLAEFETDAEQNLSCCILMLDILLKQMELQNIDKHTGINSHLCKDVCRLLKSMVTATWIGSHTCMTKTECVYCESSIMWHQLSLQLVKYLSPVNPAHPPDPHIDDTIEDGCSRKSPPETDKRESKPDVVINMPIPEVHSVGGVLVHMPHVCSIMTATVETVSEQLDLAAIIPAEKVVSAVARAITLSETDVATATVQIAKPQVMNENDQPVEPGPDDDLEDFWHTSVGKFRFTIDDLPEQLQYIYQLLKQLPQTEKPDVLYYMLQCLNVLCLNGDAFTKAAKEHRGFFIWSQENLLIKNLWDLCNSEHSHICEVGVPLLLHCITLPAGSDVFWRVIQDEFHNSDWRVRFVAVDRVTVIARFMDSTPLRAVLPLQAALANAFCYLISSMDDPNVYIAQRATLNLGTIHDTAIKALILCLETQFDSVIVDRPMVLQSLYQLHNSLSDRKILTWEFFLNRFDALFLEAQINLEKNGDITCLRDLRNTDLNSEVFIRKLHRAHEALSQSDGSGGSVKTLSASFGTKWPYKRTMSAPASMIPRHDIKQDGHIHSLNTVDDGNLVGFLHRVIDLEEADKETMHLLVFLLMQFLSRSDQAFPAGDKHLSKTQNIVLHHLYLLLGYNQNGKGLYISPQRLRASPVFSVYLSNLPQLLDQNHLMGWMLVNNSLILLQYCPSPHHIVLTEYQPLTYTLWYLEPHARRSWLMSLVVLLYKYQYNQQPQCMQLQALIKIVLNTLDSQHHHCRRIPATVVMGSAPSRSRDVSQPSLGTDNEHVERLNTPPLSPMYYGGSGDSQSGHISVSTKAGKMQVIYHQKPLPNLGMETHWEENITEKKWDKFKNVEMSIEADDTESELNAIPGSDVSDSTLHGSAQESFDEVINNGDAVQTVQQKNVNTRAASTNKDFTNENKSICKDVQVMHQLKVIGKRPTWFIGSEEESLQNSDKKWGVHEGVKIMVTSSLLSNIPVSQPQRAILGPINSSRNCTKVPSFTASSLAYSMAAVTTIPTIPVAKTATTDYHKQIFSTSTELHQSPNEFKNLKFYDKKHSDSSATQVCTPASDSLSETSTSLQCDEMPSHFMWPVDQCDKLAASQPVLQTPSVERLLPIGAIRTQDFPKEYDSENNFPSDLTSPSTESHLEIPIQERLLPIGHHNKDITQLVEKVRQALGMTAQNIKQEETNRSVESNVNCSKKSSKLSKSEETQNNSTSPRRLIKQVALESPPHLHDEDSSYHRHMSHDKKDMVHNQRQRMRKTGPFTISSHSLSENPRRPGSWYGPQFTPWFETDLQQLSGPNIDLKQSAFRIGDECVSNRCSECGILREEYSDEEIGLCIIILGTFIHREPALAAPMLPDILNIVAKIAVNATYPWQHETNTHLPGGAIAVAHQFLRCVLHQFAPNGIFVQMFQTQASDATRMQFFKSVSQALLDFNELNPIAPLQILLESLNSKKILPLETLPVVLQNIACYLDCLPLEVGLGPASPIWSALLSQLEILFRRIILLLNVLDDTIPLLRIMVSVLKIPGVTQYKGILDPFSKVLGFAVQTQSIKYQYLVDLCYLCNRAFTRERDKLFLCRTVVFELVQALKFKASIPDTNFLMLINLVLQDVGGSIAAQTIVNESSLGLDYGTLYSTNISECMRLSLNDILEFLTDFHTLAKMKSYCPAGSAGLNDDTLGGIIKSSIAQYLALEITRGNGRDNRAVVKYFPWLYTASPLQQSSREFLECIGHIRLLSWLLVGSLTHTAIHGSGNTHSISHCVSQPIPQEASCQIADHIEIIMTGFVEQSKASVFHMSSLFHTFVLCQLWTVYLEQGLNNNPPLSEGYNITMNTVFDFWSKVTPCILQLISHSKGLSEIVSSHFLSMLEALLECRSTLLAKMLPLWTHILYSHDIHFPSHLQVRLQNCRNFPPTVHQEALPTKKKPPIYSPILLKWLQRLQFKMGQIELQSSSATQFYSL